MQSCVQNITTVRYLLDLRANIVTSPTAVSGQRPRLTLTFFCTLLRYFSVVLYK